jgi:hypothetical protein
MATTETDHVGRIIDVTLRRRPAADKQRHGDPTRRDELLDPPTRAEVLAALRLLRGVWIYAPSSCTAAGTAGAVEALLRCLVAGVPPPPRDSPADLVARALEQWQREGGGSGGGGSSGSGGSSGGSGGGGGSGDGSGGGSGGSGGGGGGGAGEGATGEGGGDSQTQDRASEKKKGPPVMIAFPEGRGEEGEAPRAMTIGWKVDDPTTAFGQPSEDEVRCEALEALLTLLAEDRECQRDFMRRGGVSTVAAFLVPWLAEGGGEDTPGEVVQRCIVFLGVLIQHILPSGGGGGQLGKALAAEAEATLEETIGVEATKEILIAAEELDDTPPGNPLLDDSDDDGGSFGSPGGGGGGGGGARTEKTEREVGEELLAGSLEAMRVSGVDMSQMNDVLTQMTQAQQQGQESTTQQDS